MDRVSRDTMLMELAQVIGKRGTCSRLQVGVVFSRDGRIISTGYNGAPAGIEHCIHEQWESGQGIVPPPLLAEWLNRQQQRWQSWYETGERSLRDPGMLDAGEPLNPSAYMNPGTIWEYNNGEVNMYFAGHASSGCTRSEHAERNAIAFSARHGVALEGTEMHVTHGTCKACAMAVINAGVVRVVYATPYRKDDGLKLMEQVGIEVVHLDTE